MDLDYHLILVGGSVENLCLAYLLKERRPDLAFVLIEEAEAFKNTAVSGFLGAELKQELHELLLPLTTHRWPRYEVRFPTFHKEIRSSCFYLPHDFFLEKFGKTIEEKNLIFGETAEAICPMSVTLGSRGEIFADAVVARTYSHESERPRTRLNALGLHIVCEKKHELDYPIWIDAEGGNPQVFFRVFPLSEKELMILRYTTQPDKSLEDEREEILTYAIANFWKPKELVRERVFHSYVNEGDAFYSGKEWVKAIELADGVCRFQKPDYAHIVALRQRIQKRLEPSLPAKWLLKDDTFSLAWEKLYLQPDETVFRYHQSDLTIADSVRLFSQRHYQRRKTARSLEPKPPEL